MLKFKVEKLSKEDFINKVGNIQSARFEFIYNLKKMDLRKIYRLIADVIEDDWAVSKVLRENNKIIVFGDRRQKRKVAFPEIDNHFNRQKDRYQFHTLLAALSFTPKKRIALDIGGHIGLYSMALQDTFKSVVGFEPSPINADCYQKNADKAILHRVALGESEGKIKLNLAGDNTGNNSIIESFNYRTIEVPMKTLDSFHFENVDLIKIDVQGYEPQVLRGAKETILANKPVIIVELITHKKDPPNKEAMGILESYKYETLAIIGKDYIMGKK